MDFESWRCSHNMALFCPPEGCSKTFGCARDRGWKPGDPTPEGCDGITRGTPTPAAEPHKRPAWAIR